MLGRGRGSEEIHMRNKRKVIVDNFVHFSAACCNKTDGCGVYVIFISSGIILCDATTFN